MIAIYHLITGLVFVAVSPFLLVRMAFNADFREEMLERWSNWKSLPACNDTLWVHASSVGEVRVARVLIQGLLKRFPHHQVVLSTFTPTGYRQAVEFDLCPVFRLPPDLFWLTAGVLDRLHPALLVLIEAEFWPGLLHQCAAREVPVLLVNGRMSRKSARRYRQIAPLFRWMVAGVNRFAMRSEEDTERLLSLGIPEARVDTTGNMKFDALPETAATPQERQDASLVVFGSTRPGDEPPILDAITRLMQEVGNAPKRFVLAPRHPNRCDEVEAMLLNRGLHYQRFSELDGQPNDDTAIVLVDEIGHLNDFYRQSQLAFVGGGFSPEFGGQNILEPALHGVPVVFGPHMDNFREEARLLVESGGGIQLTSEDELYPVLRNLLEQPEDIELRGRLAHETVEKNRGALDANLRILEQLLAPTTE
ncbi:putative 3-deoxy-D-manno-octulosonic-acid transferase [Nitrospina gracilis 3/211]|uniref:3-deoxy-D-manno-octulosonic acid transferase n=1 Tax=Nitrospina gracilis (strain 3/211) TaxID=1266370 RepID=M1YX84_NITG3|nr:MULTISPECIES: 3-deoxy-D-manno-octulosonic acid transferase [Nitrospina]MCF8723240.1 3-deoxy-D-manno-octulosonic-acid transferase [Nitrospina sp. Nb-3]CCQ90289.1 putative 3-deoxy-D-manno-octulosonic-acid transferase [Nitrospina gracilis 3/211]